MKSIQEYNQFVLEKLSKYLYFHEKNITKQDVDYMMQYCENKVEAYKHLLVALLNIDDKFVIREYFDKMLTELKLQDYQNNEYYKNIKCSNVVVGEWEYKYGKYDAYELFVQDDFLYEGQKVVPQLGFFGEKFKFPAIYQNGLLWMSVTPNEVNTMKQDIINAHGRVLTFGLGLGYFAYMCSIKDDVEIVDIVEKDESVIKLFNQYILPQFSHKAKINIIKGDAYEFLDKQKSIDYDYVLVDIYHDAQDGLVVYKNMQKYYDKFSKAKPHFWIEKTLKYYI